MMIHTNANARHRSLATLVLGGAGSSHAGRWRTGRWPPAPAAPLAKPPPAGASITLSGETAGDTLTVTLVKVVTSGVSPTGRFSTPDAGDRYVAIQFRLADSGTRAYSDNPYVSVQMLDAAGQSYQPDITLTDSSAGLA